MRRFSLIYCALPLTLAASMIGCADPTADAPKAVVNDVAPETAPTPATAAVEYPLAGSIGFVGSKVTGSHDGGFENFSGTVSVVGDTVEGSSVKVTIDTTSLWADNEKLTKHLKSEDFFAVETFPTATFESTSITAGDEGAYTVTGNLSLHGITKQISFPADIALSAEGYTAKAEFSILRFDFDIAFTGKKDDLIRDDVLIKLDLSSSMTDDETMDPADDTMVDEDSAGVS
ncbi:MAG: YceI family protein [Thermoanaerobaculia bacterium]|nr:YceI family protein [Thermoanaerobaculia bacterium]